VSRVGASVCRNRTSVPPGRHFPLRSPGGGASNGIHASVEETLIFSFLFFLFSPSQRGPSSPVRPRLLSPFPQNSRDARDSFQVPTCEYHFAVKPVRSCPAVGSSADRVYHLIIPSPAGDVAKLETRPSHQMFRNITAHSLSIDEYE
jgi:hypothetical protein